jgi:hypothetical protein
MRRLQAAQGGTLRIHADMRRDRQGPSFVAAIDPAGAVEAGSAILCDDLYLCAAALVARRLCRMTRAKVGQLADREAVLLIEPGKFEPVLLLRGVCRATTFLYFAGTESGSDALA